jgi:hypothetical protein
MVEMSFPPLFWLSNPPDLPLALGSQEHYYAALVDSQIVELFAGRTQTEKLHMWYFVMPLLKIVHTRFDTCGIACRDAARCVAPCYRT